MHGDAVFAVCLRLCMYLTHSNSVRDDDDDDDDMID